MAKKSVESGPVLQPRAAWPHPCGDLGRSFCSSNSGPGRNQPVKRWTYVHHTPLIAPPVIDPDGKLFLLDASSRLTMVSEWGHEEWHVQLRGEAMPDFSSPSLWEWEGEQVVLVNTTNGLLWIRPKDRVFKRRFPARPRYFLGLVPEGCVFLDKRGIYLASFEGRDIWERSFRGEIDDVACPVIGADGLVYFLATVRGTTKKTENDQFVTARSLRWKDGEPEEKELASMLVYSPNAKGTMCLTDKYKFWVLDGTRIGTHRTKETDFTGIEFTIHGGYGDFVLLRDENGGKMHTSYARKKLVTWAMSRNVVAACIDKKAYVYSIDSGFLFGNKPSGEVLWARSLAEGGDWISIGTDGQLIVSDRTGLVMCFESELVRRKRLETGK